MYTEPVTEPWRWQVYDDPDFRGAECLFKASNGVLWTGSLNGVVRYDGKTCTRFGESEGLHRGYPLQFQEASDGTIYYSTFKTVHFLKNGKWIELFPEVLNASCKINFLLVDLNNTVWLGLTSGMLQIEHGERTLWVSHIHSDLKKFSTLFTQVRVIGANDPLDLNTLQIPVEEPSSQDSPVQFMAGYQNKDGSIWLATNNQRLYYIEPRSIHTDSIPCWSSYNVPKSINLPNVLAVSEMADGSVWVIGNDAASPIVRFSPSRNEWKSVREEIPFMISNFQNAIAQSLDGTIWITGRNSLLKYKNGQWKQFKDRDLPFSEAATTHLMATTDHSLWLAFRKKGIARLDLSTDRWLSYQGLHFQAEESNGNQWFISTDRRVVHKQADQWRILGAQDGLIHFPHAIFVTRSGMIWVYGTHDGKTAVSWLAKGQWHKKIFKNRTAKLSQLSMLEDKDGTIWFGAGRQVPGQSHTEGLLRCTPAPDGEGMAFKIFPNPPDDPYPSRGIAQDFDGSILAGGQLKKLKQGKLEYYREEGLPPRMIYLLQEGEKCWMLTGRFDLLLKEGSKRTLFKSSESSLNGAIHSFLSWNNNTLWAETDRGIHYFDGSAWTQQTLHKLLVQSSNLYGLHSNNEQTLWINLGRKYNTKRFSDIFSTVRYQKGTNLPETRIVQSPLDGRHYQAAPLFLEWGGSDLWNQTPAAELHYSYRLNQGAWSPFSATTQHMFTDLSTGKQQFEVRARNRDLNIDPTPATVSFMIVGPLWLRPWFILLVGLVIATIVYLVIRLIRSHNLRVTDRFKFEKEQAEQHQKLDQFRLEFFTNISHELRTPLTLILGPLEKLAAAANTPSLKEHGELAKRNANRLLKLINQLLDMRKLQEGKFKLEATQGDISLFIENLTASFKLLADKKTVSIEIDTPADPLLAHFDPDKLETIITNLISNAIKFTPDSSKVSVRLTSQAESLYIAIEDSGIGIDPAYQQHIFDRFVQVPSPTSDKCGSGIGLNLVRELTELHGGTITVESPIFADTASGTRFTVQLPIHQERAAKPEMEPESELTLEPETEERPVPTADSPEKSRILVIEDNPDMRRFIGMELEANYTVLEAKDGQQGVQMALDLIPDLIVSDIMMPKMDGFEVCTTLKENLLTSHIPIILLTARGSLDARIEGLKTGADDYVIKPFNSELLNVRVQNLLKIRQQLRQRFSAEPDAGPAEVTVSALDTTFLENAIRIVEENLENPDFKGEVFAQLMGISIAGLYRKLGAITDQSVSQFIRTVRLKKAGQLLATSGCSVTEIAYKVGFSSQSYFTRCFTQEFGLSPSDYLKSLS